MVCIMWEGIGGLWGCVGGEGSSGWGKGGVR